MPLSKEKEDLEAPNMTRRGSQYHQKKKKQRIKVEATMSHSDTLTD